MEDLTIFVKGTDEDNPGLPTFDDHDDMGTVPASGSSLEFTSASEWGEGAHNVDLVPELGQRPVCPLMLKCNHSSLEPPVCVVVNRDLGERDGNPGPARRRILNGALRVTMLLPSLVSATELNTHRPSRRCQRCPRWGRSR